MRAEFNETSSQKGHFPLSRFDHLLQHVRGFNRSIDNPNYMLARVRVELFSLPKGRLHRNTGMSQT